MRFEIIIGTLIIYYILALLYVKTGEFIFKYFLVWAFFPLVFFNRLYTKRNSEYKANTNHIAIILCNSYLPERILIYMEKLPRLIKYFKKRKWPYKVHFGTNKKELKKIIKNPKTKIIYIFGHGQRHGVKLNNKEMAYYCEFEGYPKKKFIAQLHCNHYAGKSLVEYISENSIKGFVTNKKINSKKISKFIKDVTKGKYHEKP